MSRPERKQGLRKKLVWATLLVGVLPVALGLVLTYLKGTYELRKALGANFAGLAQEAANKTDLVISHEMAAMLQIAASAEVLDAVLEANRAYRGLSKPAVAQRLQRLSRDWEEAQRGQAKRHPILSNRAAAHLMKTLRSHEETAAYLGLYVTDMRGLLVASINDLPPFLSSETIGWQKVYSDGRGQPYLGDIYRYEQTHRFLFDLGVPILDPSTGRAIGVLMQVNDVDGIFKTPIHEIRFGKTGHAMLIDGEGRVLTCPILPTGMHVADPVLIRAVTGPGANWTVVRNDAHGGTDSIIGSSPAADVNRILTQSGSAAWFSFIRQDPKELYAPIRSLLTYAAAASVTLLGLMVLLALAVSKRLVRPVHLLHEGTELIGQGNLDYRLKIKTNDEIEQLADEFNQMASRLKESYATLEQRVADRTRELATLNTVAITVNQSLDLQHVLETTVTRVAEAMRAEAVAIRLWDPDRQQLLYRAARGLPDDYLRQREQIGLTGTISGRAFQSGQPIVIADTREDDRVNPGLKALGVQAITAIPIKTRDRILGSLSAMRISSSSAFTGTDLNLLVAIGAQIGTAIEHADLYRREQAMVEKLKEADRFKSEFLSNVSHELRSPLTSIIGFSELLLDRIPGNLTLDQEDYIRNMQDSGHLLLSIINNLLNLSKLRAGRMKIDCQRFELAPLIENLKQMVTPLSARKGLHLETTVERATPPLFSDEEKVRQILLNLLSNAVKFTQTGGVIRIRAGLATLENRPAAEISVSDTGIGIRPEDRAKIFEEFQQVDSSYTRDYPGTGLGLSITKQFVGLLGGRITMESQYGQGSTFTVVLPSQPLTIPTATEAGAEAVSTTVPLKDREVDLVPEPLHPPGDISSTAPLTFPRILVVEDDPTVSRLLSLYLSQAGYHVDHAMNGDEAIEKARLLRPFAITLDIMLPRRDGWEVLRILKQTPETKDIPVIIVSIIENQQLGFSLGAIDYLTKPIDRKALLESLRKLSLTTQIKRRPITILVIDDDPKILQLVAAILEAEGFGVLQARQAAEGIDLAIEVQPDLILLDLMMPDVDGFEALERLKLHPTAKNIPVIIFTARTLTEEDRNRLNSKIRGIIHKGQSLRESLLSEIRKFEKLYPDLAQMVDGLTGLYNERYLKNRLADEVSRALRVRRTFSLLLTNLDRFQSFNQQFGIETGNRVLREAAELFRRSMRAANPLCRCGGTTFAVLLTETTKESAAMVGEKLRAAIAGHGFLDHNKASDKDSKTHRFTISIGVATFLEDCETAEQLIVQATRALDEARSRGGDCVIKSSGLSIPGRPGGGTG